MGNDKTTIEKLSQNLKISRSYYDSSGRYCEVYNVEVQGQIPMGDEYYADLANEIGKHLQGMYEEQLRELGKGKVKWVQVDIENAIKLAKDGKY